MKTYWKHVLAALGLSLVGSISFQVLAPFVGSYDSARLTISVLAAIYLAYVVHQSGIKTGRLTTALVWLAIGGVSVLLNVSMTSWIAIQVFSVWAIRSIYLHDSFLTAGADALLNGFAVAASLVTAWHTRSTFLAFWVFFLIQASYLWLPRLHHPRNPQKITEPNPFNQAQSIANNALSQLQKTV